MICLPFIDAMPMTLTKLGVPLAWEATTSSGAKHKNSAQWIFPSFKWVICSDSSCQKKNLSFSFTASSSMVGRNAVFVLLFQTTSNVALTCGQIALEWPWS